MRVPKCTWVAQALFCQLYLDSLMTVIPINMHESNQLVYMWTVPFAVHRTSAPCTWRVRFQKHTFKITRRKAESTNGST